MVTSTYMLTIPRYLWMICLKNYIIFFIGVSKVIIAVINWSLMFINRSSTYYPKNKPNRFAEQSIFMNYPRLEWVESYTYLGIRIDSNLTFDHLFNCAVKMVYILKLMFTANETEKSDYEKIYGRSFGLAEQGQTNIILTILLSTCCKWTCLYFYNFG